MQCTVSAMQCTQFLQYKYKARGFCRNMFNSCSAGPEHSSEALLMILSEDGLDRGGWSSLSIHLHFTSPHNFAESTNQREEFYPHQYYQKSTNQAKTKLPRQEYNKRKRNDQGTEDLRKNQGLLLDLPATETSTSSDHTPINRS